MRAVRARERQTGERDKRQRAILSLSRSLFIASLCTVCVEESVCRDCECACGVLCCDVMFERARARAVRRRVSYRIYHNTSEWKAWPSHDVTTYRVIKIERTSA